MFAADEAEGERGIDLVNGKHKIPKYFFTFKLEQRKINLRAQRLINLEIPVLVRLLKSSNVELG